MQQDQQAMQDMKVILPVCYSCDVSSKYWKISMFGPSKDFTQNHVVMASHGLDEGMLWGMHLGRGEGQQLDAIAARVPWRIVSNTTRYSKRHSSMLWLYIWKIPKHIKKRQKCQDKIKTLSANQLPTTCFLSFVLS